MDTSLAELRLLSSLEVCWWMSQRWRDGDWKAAGVQRTLGNTIFYWTAQANWFLSRKSYVTPRLIILNFQFVDHKFHILTMTLILNISCLLDRIKPQMRATLYFNNILHFFSFVFSKFVLSWDISIHETKKEDWRYRRLYHGKNCFNVIKLSKYCCYKSNCNLSCNIEQWDIGNIGHITYQIC